MHGLIQLPKFVSFNSQSLSHSLFLPSYHQFIIIVITRRSEEMESRRLCCFLLLAIQIVSWVSATSRPFAPNDGLGFGVHQTGQSPQALPVTTDRNLSSKKGYSFYSKIGSTPPSCEHKCYGCIPCEAIQVPTTSKQIQYANYEPEGWKCKCGPSFYTP